MSDPVAAREIATSAALTMSFMLMPPDDSDESHNAMAWGRFPRDRTGPFAETCPRMLAEIWRFGGKRLLEDDGREMLSAKAANPTAALRAERQRVGRK